MEGIVIELLPPNLIYESAVCVFLLLRNYRSRTLQFFRSVELSFSRLGIMETFVR